MVSFRTADSLTPSLSASSTLVMRCALIAEYRASLAATTVGTGTDSVAVGMDVGMAVGANVGVAVGVDVGMAVGASVGVAVGMDVGMAVDVGLGVSVGIGAGLGLSVGADVGVSLGTGVGAAPSLQAVRTTVMSRTPRPESNGIRRANLIT